MKTSIKHEKHLLFLFFEDNNSIAIKTAAQSCL